VHTATILAVRRPAATRNLAGSVTKKEILKPTISGRSEYVADWSMMVKSERASRIAMRSGTKTWKNRSSIRRTPPGNSSSSARPMVFPHQPGFAAPAKSRCQRHGTIVTIATAARGLWDWANTPAAAAGHENEISRKSPPCGNSRQSGCCCCG